MAMQVLSSLTPTQLAAGNQIYNGFYNYAIGQGADSGAATQFANMGLGVSTGEGLGKTNPWSTNPDNSVTALGPFQLNLNGGVGSEFGLNANSSPAAQINAAASTMWGNPGTGGYFNTTPWNAVGDTTGPGSGVGNDTYAGQTAAENIGAQTAAANGITASGAPVGGDTSSTPDASSPGGGVNTQGGLGGSVQYAPSDVAPGGGVSQSTLDQLNQQNQASSNVTTQIQNGLWEYAGVGAVTTAGAEQAKATGAAAQTEAKTAAADTQALNKTATANTASQNKTAVADTGSLTSTLTGIASAGFSNIFDIFTRGAVVILGLVFIAGAVYLAGSTVGNNTSKLRSAI